MLMLSPDVTKVSPCTVRFATESAVKVILPVPDRKLVPPDTVMLFPVITFVPPEA